jgi:predicted metalloprotease with PDZ domain
LPESRKSKIPDLQWKVVLGGCSRQTYDMRVILVLLFVGWSGALAMAQEKKPDAASIVGIGVVIVERDGSHVIRDLVPNGPAMKAGVISYDKIVQVDDRQVDQLSLKEIVALIRGRQGTVVKIVVERAGSSSPLTFSVMRAVIHLDERTTGRPAPKPVSHNHDNIVL